MVRPRILQPDGEPVRAVEVTTGGEDYLFFISLNGEPLAAAAMEQPEGYTNILLPKLPGVAITISDEYNPGRILLLARVLAEVGVILLDSDYHMTTFVGLKESVAKIKEEDDVDS